MASDIVLHDESIEIIDTLTVRGRVQVRQTGGQPGAPHSLRVDLDDGEIKFQGLTARGTVTSAVLSVRKLGHIDEVLCGELAAASVASQQIEVGTARSDEPSDAGRLTVKNAGGRNGVVLDGRGTVSARRPFKTLSDVRCKQDLKTVDGALAAIRQLRGVRFKWDDGGASDADLGLIAQEVLPVLPELVSEGTDGQMSVAYAGMIPVLIEAVKEQQQIIDKQASQLGRLEARLAALEATVTPTST